MIDWRHWHNEPWLVGGLVLLGWIWAILAGPLRSRLAAAAPFPRRQAIQFYAGLLIFYLAVGSPLDQIGERFLFSAHMLQHQLLIYPAALLFLVGLPHWMVDPVLGARPLRPAFRVLVNPITCALVYALVIGLWHRTDAYNLALQNKVVHVAEHLSFFSVALLYWWPVASPSRVLPPLRYGPQMLYLVGVLIAMTPVFAYITFSQDILYPTYEFAPRIFPEFSAADDQLLAGVAMKLIGMLVALAAFGVAFFRWFEAKK
jgi:putative membrane protein